eukprot:1546733-Amphidinium_carterae.1
MKDASYRQKLWELFERLQVQMWRHNEVKQIKGIETKAEIHHRQFSKFTSTAHTCVLGLAVCDKCWNSSVFLAWGDGCLVRLCCVARKNYLEIISAVRDQLRSGKQ